MAIIRATTCSEEAAGPFTEFHHFGSSNLGHLPGQASTVDFSENALSAKGMKELRMGTTAAVEGLSKGINIDFNDVLS